MGEQAVPGQLRDNSTPQPPAGGAAPGGGAPGRLGARVGEENVLAERVRGHGDRTALGDPGRLVDELRQVRPALEHEGVDHDAIARAPVDLSERLVDGLEGRRISEVSLAVLSDVSSRLAVRDHDDLAVASVLRQERARALESMPAGG